MRRYILFYLSPMLMFGAENYSEYMEESYNALFSYVNSFIWMMAIFPLVVFIYAISLARKKLAKEATGQGSSPEGKLKASGIESIGVYVWHGVISQVSVFLIYGIFAITYANADSISKAWNELVIKFWQHAFLG